MIVQPSTALLLDDDAVPTSQSGDANVPTRALCDATCLPALV